MKQTKKQISFNIDSDLYKKFNYICDYYGIELKEQILFSMRHFVYGFEQKHGEINRSLT